MANFIPAGFEENDEEFDGYLDDYDDYDRGHQKRVTQAVVKPLPTADNLCPHKSVSPNRKMFMLPSPTRRSPSADSLVLDDLRVAVLHGNLQYIESQIEMIDNFFIDTILNAGFTLLMYASNCGHPSIVEYCLNKGADPNYHKDNFTPLMAVSSCTTNDENEDKNKNNLLLCAQHLIKFGANVNACDSYGNTSLHFAAKFGKYRLVIELLDNGAEINRQNIDGWTALHFASYNGYSLVIRRLINTDVDVNITTYDGKTAAQIAGERGFDIIKDILDRVKLRTADNDGDNPNLTEGETRRLSAEDCQLLETKMIANKTESQKQINSFSDLESFLRTLNLSHLISNFTEKGIKYENFETLTEEDLENIGIKELSVKRRILNALLMIHKQEWRKESLRDVSSELNLNCPEVMSIMANIANHITRIDNTIVALRNKLDRNPDIMSYKSDACDVNKVIDESMQAITSTRSLHQQLNDFSEQLINMNDNSFKPVDRIQLDDEIFMRHKRKFRLTFANGLMFICFGVCGLMIAKYSGDLRQTFRNFIKIL